LILKKEIKYKKTKNKKGKHKKADLVPDIKIIKKVINKFKRIYTISFFKIILSKSNK
jgi:hypothetical protein